MHEGESRKISIIDSPWEFSFLAYCMDHDPAFISQNAELLYEKWAVMLDHSHVLCDYGKK